MSKTIHLPTADETNGFEVKFPAAKIRDSRRVDITSAQAKFACNLSTKDIEKLCEHMGWPLPGDRESLQKLDGKLKGGHFIFTPKLDNDERLKLKSQNGDVDVDAEIDLEYAEISSFELHRFEIEGRKRKGFRRELRFTATFPAKCQDAMANVESYMFRTDNARGTLKVKYYPEATQPELPGTESDEDQGQLDIDSIEATPEQRAAVAEIPAETGTLASARAMGARRGRLADQAN